MTHEEADKVIDFFNECRGNWTCYMCQSHVGASDCEECPIKANVIMIAKGYNIIKNEWLDDGIKH